MVKNFDLSDTSQSSYKKSLQTNKAFHESFHNAQGVFPKKPPNQKPAPNNHHAAITQELKSHLIRSKTPSFWRLLGPLALPTAHRFARTIASRPANPTCTAECAAEMVNCLK